MRPWNRELWLFTHMWLRFFLQKMAEGCLRMEYPGWRGFGQNDKRVV
jgi:hypothetical protein